MFILSIMAIMLFLCSLLMFGQVCGLSELMPYMGPVSVDICIVITVV